MRPKNKIVSALKDRSGASLIFVLGVMLMLLAVGASVLAAAFGNIGIGIRQENYNRAMLLGDSIHRNIEHSLNMTGVPEIMFDTSLSGQIAHQIHNSFNYEIEKGRSGLFFAEMEDIVLVVTIDDDLPIRDVQRVTLSFPSVSARILPFTAGVPELCNHLADAVCPFCKKPQTVRLNATMLVSVVVNVDRAARDRRVVTFEAVYEYRDGILTGPPDGPPVAPPEDPPEDAISDMVFLPENQGRWEMVSFEIIEGKI